MTPLHAQFCTTSSDSSYWNGAVVKALLNAGADVNLVNRFGVTVLDTVTGEHIYHFVQEDAMRVLGEHALRLREAGFDLSNENLASLFVDFFHMKSRRKKCRCKLNSVSLDERTTLCDVLRFIDPYTRKTFWTHTDGSLTLPHSPGTRFSVPS